MPEEYIFEEYVDPGEAVQEMLLRTKQVCDNNEPAKGSPWYLQIWAVETDGV